jgi:probable HAF family extracellular repeat protein
VKGEGANGAFLYTTGPVPTELPSGGVTPVDAFAINDSGTVVGVGKNAAGQTVAFRYTSAGLVADLGVLSADDPASYAYGINTGGVAVGYSGDFTSRAVLFPVDAAPADLGVLPDGSTSYGYGLNDAGTVAGCATDANGYQRACVKRASEALEDLGTLGGTTSCGLAINTAGQITGWATRADGYAEAFLYTPGADPQVQGLGKLTFASSVAFALNDAGAVVGYLTGSDWSQRAFLYTTTGGMIDLNDRIDPALGWTLEQAVGINGAGQIVGIGRINGQYRGFRLTPPAEPETPEEPTEDPPDTTPPTIDKLTASPSVLWPPVGQLVRVRVLVTASDDTDPEPVCRIVRVTSDQVDRRRHFSKQADIVVVGDLSVKLRAELLPTKYRDRVYTITVGCADASGNTGTAEARVRVVRLPPWFWRFWR